MSAMIIPENGKLKINLWTYNHPFFGISDQVSFFVMVFQRNGYDVTVSNSPSDESLNVVIENFDKDTQSTLIEFCRDRKFRVAVIMTEHIDFLDGNILIHGEKLWNTNDYMHPATQINRLRRLIALQPYLRCFFVLGDLPELKNIDKMILGVEVCKIPFPKLDIVETRDVVPESDLLFTGFQTEYRQSLLTNLSAFGLSIRSPSAFVSHEKRDELNQQSKLILNLPQRKSWRWLSSMRILAALRCGRATVSLGTNDTCEMSKCTYQIDIDNKGWKDELKSFVVNWRDLYEKASSDYATMVDDFEHRHPFPHDMIEYWAITDRMPRSVHA